MQLNSPNPIENIYAKATVSAAFEVYNQLGPGLLESVYQECLCLEIRRAGLQVQSEVYLPVMYKEIKMSSTFRIDLLVENKLIIEVKAVTELAGVHYAQLRTYLRLSEIRLGLLINFNTDLLKNNIRRVANGLY